MERLTALYDISRVFSSTLELSELLPIMAEKIRDILEAGACNIWLVESEAHELKFAQQAGEDPTTDQSARIPVGEGFLGQVANQGEPAPGGKRGSGAAVGRAAAGGRGF